MCLIGGLCFGGWNVADGLKQAPVVEPVDPLERGELDGFEGPPGSALVDGFGVVKAV